MATQEAPAPNGRERSSMPPQEEIPNTADEVAAARQHYKKTAGRPQCFFHLRGLCSKGFACNFSHDTSSSSSSDGLASKLTDEESKEMEKKKMAHQKKTLAAPTCRHFSKGYCFKGYECKFSHSLSRSINAADTSSENGESESKEEKELQGAAGSKNDNNDKRGDEDNDQGMCAICHTEFRHKEGPKVGLMESCDHHFCYECILKWRGHEQVNSEITKETKRTCPMCRKPSYFVIPSARPLSGASRITAINNFKGICAARTCKYYLPNPGEGEETTFIENHSCKFGHFCFYAHKNLDGSDAKPAQQRQRNLSKQMESIRNSLETLVEGLDLASLVSMFNSINDGTDIDPQAARGMVIAQMRDAMGLNN